MARQEVFDHVHHLRVKSWGLLHEASGFVVSERLRQLNHRLIKYSPDQPRVPAGQRNGGQWTNGGSGVATNELTRSEGIVRNTLPRSEVSNRANYPMGGEVINPNTQQPYVWPDDLDVGKNTRFGREFSRVGGTQIEKALVMGYLFRAGGPQDYQRPNGLLAALGGVERCSTVMRRTIIMVQFLHLWGTRKRKLSLPRGRIIGILVI